MPKTEFITLDAAAALVQDGMTLALGGMTLYRRPVGFIRGLLRRAQRPRDLTLLCFTAGIESDLLIGAGCVRSIRTVYFGLETFGFAPMFTAAEQAGRSHIIEETEQSIAMGLRARMAGVGFMPSRAWLSTDLPALRPDVKTVRDPYSDDVLIAFPAIGCDVTVIHGLEADRRGNVRVNHNLGVDLELVYVSDIVIATVERVVNEPLVRSTDGTLIPSPGIHYVVECPRGAFPTSCYPLYPVAGGEFMRYVDMCGAGQFDQYLDSILNER